MVTARLLRDFHRQIIISDGRPRIRYAKDRAGTGRSSVSQAMKIHQQSLFVGGPVCFSCFILFCFCVRACVCDHFFWEGSVFLVGAITCSVVIFVLGVEVTFSDFVGHFGCDSGSTFGYESQFIFLGGAGDGAGGGACGFCE